MKKPFIWRLCLFGNFELLGIYANIAAAEADSTEIKFAMKLFDGISVGLMKDPNRMYVQGLFTLRYL